jgi:uncharacterized protein (UPF0248 family)
MIPIHELLSRIRWDRQFGEGDFVIGYYDRVEDAVIRVPMRELFFQPDNHFAFDLIDRDGVLHSVPLHRIREVYRNDKLIWHRTH